MAQKIQQRGFTLVELIMVIVIMGVIGGMVSVFMKSPIDAYIASGRRAALTDVADTAARRIARDLHKALPNSIRISADNLCVEFIPTKTGGRYRTGNIAADDGTSLDFSAADTTFNMLGDNNDSNAAVPLDQLISVKDIVAIYNLGIPNADAYQGDNTSPVVAPKPARAGSAPNYETVINIASKKFPLTSGGNRFHVIPVAEQVVGYVCTGDGTMRRYVRTLPSPALASCPLPAAVAADPIIASKVDSCNFTYNPNQQRDALVGITLTFKDELSKESVRLYHEVHVDNTP